MGVMPLSVPFVGSGEFVPERVWSCPVHGDDVSWSWDGDPWESEGEVCLDCEFGEWRDRRAADGSLVLRELSVGEVGFRRLVEREGRLAATSALLGEVARDAKIGWLEDE